MLRLAARQRRRLFEGQLLGPQLLLELRQLAELELGGLGKVVLSLGDVDLDAQRVQLLLDILGLLRLGLLLFGA